MWITRKVKGGKEKRIRVWNYGYCKYCGRHRVEPPDKFCNRTCFDKYVMYNTLLKHKGVKMEVKASLVVDHNLTHFELRILLVLVQIADRKRIARVPHQYLADLFYTSIAPISKHLKSLRQKGYIELVNRSGARYRISNKAYTHKLVERKPKSKRKSQS